MSFNLAVAMADETMNSVTSISTTLIKHVRNNYEEALTQIISDAHFRCGTNGYSDYAIPSYILSVAVVEAFINESLLTNWSKLISKNSFLWNLSVDFREKLGILDKLIILPELLFGNTFKPNEQPYQDMKMLIKIRNDFVHFKMKPTIPKYVTDLDKRGITLKFETAKKNVDFAWTHKLSSSEGIRWAHNTACKVIARLVSYAPQERLRSDPVLQLAPNFQIISDEYPVIWFRENGYEFDSNTQ